MLGIKDIVERLIKQHGTNNPLEIASQKNIIILYEDFRNIMGYFNTSRRIAMIHVNCNLSEPIQRFVIAHELGHRFLHPNVNVPFLRNNTLMSIDKIEREANEFAVALMLYGADAEEGETVESYCARNGVPREMTKYL